MKLHRVRDFLAGALTMALVAGLAVPAGAALASKTIQVLTGSEIYVDGVKMEPTDANGNPVDTFVYNGTTYVPLRAVSEYLGKNVSWDGASQRVYIGEAPGVKQYLLSVCPPYQTAGYSTDMIYTMTGKKYTNGMSLDDNNGGMAIFNLNGQYETLEFDIGHIDGKNMEDGQYYIYLDGDLYDIIELTPEMLPKHYSIPLDNALQMKIVGGNWSWCYAMVNIEVN